MKMLFAFFALIAGNLAIAADAPVPDKGDTAWMMTSTVLVILMTIPGLALFYGGMVRSKNVLSVLMQVFVTFSLIALLWAIYGYSIAFTRATPFFGGFDRLFMAGMTAADVGGGDVQQGCLHPRVRVLRVPADLRGHHALPDRRRLRRAREVLGDAGVHGDLVHLHLPADRAHGLVLGGSGCLHGRRRRRRGGCDGGLHLPEGRAGLRGRHGGAHQRRHRRPGRRLLVGKRMGYGKVAMPPHNVPFMMIGASLLWVGWFGFNVGSNLEANGFAGLVFANTLLATAAAALAWMFVEWI